MMLDVLEFAERSRVASTVDELNGFFAKLVTGWGFTSFTAIQVSKRPDKLSRPLERMFGSGITDWGEHYKATGHVRHDPMIPALMASSVGLWWSEGERAAHYRRQRLVFDEARDFGWNHGLAIPVRLADGSVWSCALASDQMDEREEIRFAATSVAGIFVSQGAILQAGEQRPLNNGHLLTRRQRDVVLWLGRGLKAGEIGDVLGTSERTVSHHIEAAKARLGTRTQAGLVAEALLGGEILLGEIGQSAPNPPLVGVDWDNPPIRSGT